MTEVLERMGVLKSAPARRQSPGAWPNGGNPLNDKQSSPRARRDVSERFWEKVDKSDPNGCWFWTASCNDRGYGKFWTGERLSYAHRVSYEMVNGPIPEGLTLDHLCRTRNCVNPTHLEPVSLRENILRSESVSAKHARKTHCPRGHEYNEENTRWEKGRIRHCRACKRLQGGDA